MQIKLVKIISRVLIGLWPLFSFSLDISDSADGRSCQNVFMNTQIESLVDSPYEKPVPVLIATISPHIETYHHWLSPVSAKFFRTEIKFNGKIFSLNDSFGTSLDLDTTLIFKVQEIGTTRTLFLPPLMQKRMIAQLRSGIPEDFPFNCNTLASYLNGLPYAYTNFSPRHWHLKWIGKRIIIKPGDTLLFSKNRRSISHLAVYLGENYFLSKLGDGPIVVSDLASLIEVYGEPFFKSVYRGQ